MGTLISVCVPVFGTEAVLERCLLSIVEQDFSSLEVIVVNDASTGKNSKGWNAEKITKKVLKKNKIPYKYAEHKTNLGLIETRRDAVALSSGKYIFIMDSDDFLSNPCALSKLYCVAQTHDADIVNSCCTVWSNFPEERAFAVKDYEKKMSLFIPGPMEGHDIFLNFAVHKKYLGFLWAKLYKKDLVKKAFDAIPFTYCVMAEDYLLFFFLSLFAKKYYGVEERYYSYSIDSGVSSYSKINSISQWQKQCTASSVFNVLFAYIEEHYDDFTPEERNAIRQQCNQFLENNLTCLKIRVAPQLQEQAYALLCEMWGEDYVKAIEQLIQQKQ